MPHTDNPLIGCKVHLQTNKSIVQSKKDNHILNKHSQDNNHICDTICNSVKAIFIKVEKQNPDNFLVMNYWTWASSCSQESHITKLKGLVQTRLSDVWWSSQL